MQGAYEDAVTALFASLDRVEALLKASTGPYLLGEKLTEADVRLYPTIIRFDPVGNEKLIMKSYPAIHKWLRHLYWEVPAFKETTNFEHIKKINPTGVTPLGPLPHILPLEG
ncbi:glutathione S-transferase [Choiromyces venosus 120613-1]|uniref:Glutathione S-transferase n=1 Tax=Choiromyces venosus 120613-1 TaxID=1336337 RepID=A0A3N4IUP0_9PEZI|nr:glutathione S-transferase [Choiromyces venosus 120613-1]